MHTTDNKDVLYADLYLDTKVLSVVLNLDKAKGTSLCHILSLYNLMQPFFQPIKCDRQFLKSFICEKLNPIKNTTITLDPEISYERYGLMKCSNGQSGLLQW